MTKLHYGAGTVLKKNWINVDQFIPDSVRFALVERVDNKLWGWTEVDGPNEDRTVFIKLDRMTDLSCIQAGSIDEIFSSHVLEHLHPAHCYDLIGEFLRVLKPGGSMHHVVPDFDALIKLWKRLNKNYETQPEEGIVETSGRVFDMERYQTIVNGVLCPWLFGNEYPQHRGLWNKNYAEFLLRRWGFIELQIETADTDLHIKALSVVDSSNTIK
jgi:hypothetical protein